MTSTVAPDDDDGNPARFEIDPALGSLQAGVICYPQWASDRAARNGSLVWWIYLKILSEYTSVDYFAPVLAWTARLFPADLAVPNKISVKRATYAVGILVQEGVLSNLGIDEGGRSVYRVILDEPCGDV